MVSLNGLGVTHLHVFKRGKKGEIDFNNYFIKDANSTEEFSKLSRNGVSMVLKNITRLLAKQSKITDVFEIK